MLIKYRVAEVAIWQGFTNTNVLSKNLIEYHPACWVDENRLAEGEET